MKIYTWNVNSVRARHERLMAWLEKNQPEVLALQELKCQDEQFPRAEVEALGYHVETFGQKTYNGVAFISKEPIEDVRRSFEDDTDDPQSRLISAKIGDIRYLCVYVPNGSEMGSEKAAYKEQWYARLLNYLNEHHRADEKLIILGDFNVAPDDADVLKVDEWKDSVLCHPTMRGALNRLIDWGLSDVFRKVHPEGNIFSWWDYRGLGFPKNNGLRIDLLLCTKSVAAELKDAGVDREERKGKKPSDHAPVWIEV